ncbi:MAG: hypothetical protein GC131_08825 [Alphaproteobacteria bacterium]|nr:hypothetical protein [Alphaproteobacteria bacterium]
MTPDLALFWALAAFIAALAIGALLGPLMRGHGSGLGWALVIALPLAAVALYLLLGNPQLASG